MTKNTALRIFVLGLLSLTVKTMAAAEREKMIQVDPSSEMTRLLHEDDTNHDQKITIDDLRASHFLSFELKDTEGASYEVRGTYYLSNLLQELTLATHLPARPATLSKDHIFENPVERISRSIRELYWDGLTRRIDANHLKEIVKDTKVKNPGPSYIYVPSDDPESYSYFSEAAQQNKDLHLAVKKLPNDLSPNSLAAIRSAPGLLTLGLQKNS